MIKALVLSLLVSLSAFAGEVVKTSFSIFPNSGPNRAFYACDFVEYETEKVIEALGGEVLDMSCFGGLPPGGIGYPTPNNISVEFDRAAPTSNETEEIILKDSKNCHLVTNIVRGLERSFPIENVKGLGGCFNPGSSYKITITIRR